VLIEDLDVVVCVARVMTREGIGHFLAIEDIVVVVRGADEEVVAVSAIEVVRVVSAVEGIAAVAIPDAGVVAVERVLSSVAVEVIIAIAAVDGVVSGAAMDGVVGVFDAMGYWPNIPSSGNRTLSYFCCGHNGLPDLPSAEVA
jgi:hypothetical protein